MKLEKLQDYGNTTALFVGKSGSGKSSAIASYAKQGPMKIYDLDKRAAGILGSAKFLGEEIVKNITVEQLEPDKQTGDLFKTLVDNCSLDLTNTRNYKTYVYESATTIADLMLRTSKRLRGQDPEMKNKDKRRGVHHFAAPDDYNYASSTFYDLIYEYLLPLRANIIMSSWIVDEWGPNPEGPYLPDCIVGQSINTTRKLAERIPGYFDEVYYFTKEVTGSGSKPNIRYYVQFEGWLAKTAIPKLKGLGKVEVTDKCFYDVLQEILAK